MSPHETRERRSRALRIAALAGALAAMNASACQKNIECTAEVTAGAGSFKSTAKGEEKNAPALRREAVREACSKMCAPTAEKEAPKGCAAKCLVDAEAGKVGAKIDCVKAP
ncbi:MAG: hypothetical protein HUU21_09685 [Polyangiaceae bacterium]|nr:hypothetical protein [Polyangiaceae bacterium]NUQ73815.1 hypothetical protein [Polyangiaceae bacterium]